jgi:hypothetical protein
MGGAGHGLSAFVLLVPAGLIIFYTAGGVQRNVVGAFDAGEK